MLTHSVLGLDNNVNTLMHLLFTIDGRKKYIPYNKQFQAFGQYWILKPGKEFKATKTKEKKKKNQQYLLC